MMIIKDNNDSLLAKLSEEFRKVSLGSKTPLSSGLDSAMYSAGIQGGLHVIKSNCIGILKATYRSDGYLL